jgi:hypothetical protein
MALAHIIVETAHRLPALHPTTGNRPIIIILLTLSAVSSFSQQTVELVVDRTTDRQIRTATWRM